MKRCPECYEAYDNGEKFCESDGRELLADPAFTPKPKPATAAPSSKPIWWPAAACGVLVGVVIGAGIYAAVSLISVSPPNESQAARQNTDAREKALPNRVTAASISAPTPKLEESPSPTPEQPAETQPSPTANTDNKAVAVQLNQGPISTGQKTKSSESEGGVQTVIEMNDGSTLEVDAAWEDKQGIWYRRSGLVSFVDSSRVKAITARRATKAAEVFDH